MFKHFNSLFITVLCMYSSLQAQRWHHPDESTVTSYVYAPGVLVSEILMARYCPQFTASTGEHITSTKGIEVITAPASSGNFAEIKLRPINKKKKRKNKKKEKASPEQAAQLHVKERWWVRAITAPFRGLWHVISYVGSRTFLGCTFNTKSTGDCSLSMYSVDLRKVNLAQEEDLEILHAIYTKHLNRVGQEYPEKKPAVVLYGTSRGSAAVFNFYALHRPKEVRAVICEGLFDSITHIHEATKSGLIRFKIKLMRKVSNFKDDGILPLRLVECMSREIPILLITSLRDQTVPYECTLNVYNKLRAAGHDKVHIVILEKSAHINYPNGNKADRDRYQNAVHAFYKKYGLPYIQEYAELGADYFENETQPPFGPIWPEIFTNPEAAFKQF